MNVSQLGQVKNAYIEPSGKISVFFYSDEEMKFGLSILPASRTQKTGKFPVSAYHSCSHCGYTELINLPKVIICLKCGQNKFVESVKI